MLLQQNLLMESGGTGMSKFASERCVLYLEVKPLTEEHIFPDGARGCLDVGD